MDKVALLWLGVCVGWLVVGWWFAGLWGRGRGD